MPFAPRPSHPLGFSAPRPSLVTRFINTPPRSGNATPNPTEAARDKDEVKKKKKKKQEKLRADMITRVDVPVRVNAMSVGGWLSAEERKQEVEKQREEAAPAPAFAAAITESPDVSSLPAPADEEHVVVPGQAGESYALPAKQLSDALEQHQAKAKAAEPEPKQS